MPPQEREAEAQRLAHAEAQTPFDLGRAPLLRVRVLKLTADEHLMAMTMHHIISDAWSIAILIREVSELYRAFSTGHISPLPELPIQYSDFACWQQQQMEGTAFEKQLAYWKKQLGGGPPITELPADRPRRGVE